MKKINVLCSILIYLFIFSGCKRDDISKQDEGRTFVPRIFGEKLLFPDGVQVLDEGQSISFENLQYSPADKVTITWKINDAEVATGKSYKFIATKAGDYRIKVEVNYKDITVSRYTDVFVIPKTGAYTPKTYKNVVMAYIGPSGVLTNLDWNTVTHVAFKAAGITASGTLDISAGEAGRRADEVVTRAHLAGVPVLLGVSGTLSADGWNQYGTNVFGNAITNAAKRTALVQDIKAYVTSKKMDGVDIMMTDIGNDDESITVNNVAAIKTLLDELRSALGTETIITVTVTSNYVNDYYPNLSAANWLNVHAFQDRSKIGPGKALAQPSDYDYMVKSANLWKAKYPAAKLVIGIPAMGIRFIALDGNGNNLDNSSFNYLSYKSILALDPTAFDKEHADIDKGVFFNGVPLVKQKSEFIKANNFLGAYIWQGDFDTNGPNSLIKNIHDTLN
jgi:hypothetical protein